ncbi:MAG: PAS domain S-box protein [Steroidobacteraceae bacterium]|nr:PAS domain S-box protein [Steroidobacteraceae bacterium]
MSAVRPVTRVKDSRYRVVLDAIDQGFCVLQVEVDASGRTVDYRILESNPACERMTGFKGVQGRTVGEVAPQFLPLLEIYGEVARTGEPLRFETQSPALGGRWFDVYAVRIGEPDERQVAILFKDITYRREAAREREAALQGERDVRALLDAIMESASVGMCFADRDLRYQRVNRRFAEIHGLAAADLIGKRPDEILPRLGVRNVDLMLRCWREVIETGEPVEVEMEGETRAAPGERRTWQKQFFPVRQGGVIVGLGAVIKDVTERKRTEEALAASEARFRSLFELGHAGIAISEFGGRVVLANDALLRMLGFSRAEADQLDWRRLTPPEHLPRDDAMLEELRAGGTPLPYEKEFVRRDGSRITVLISGQLLPGTRDLTLAYALDITERKRAQRALRESEAQLRMLIDNMAAFVAMLAPDGTLLEVGAPMLRIGGLRREDVIGHKFWECAWWQHDAEQQACVERLVGEAAAGAVIRHDVIVRTAHDGRLSVDAMLVPVFDEGGQVTHVIASGVDVSARKRVEMALRDNETRLHQAAEALREADRRKDDFLATLAHELRNPLAPIRNGLQILRLAAGGDAMMERTMDMMDRQMRHLVRLVDDLLDVSRITRGKVALRREPVLLNHVLRNALESSRALVEPHRHAVHVHITTEPLMVHGDVDRLTQVFSNLLANAAKFTPREGNIWLTATRQGNEAVVSVRDNGIGIPPERIGRVFEMFAQAHAPRGSDGLGIGLALVRELVQMHGGSVNVSSPGQDQGSEFTVRLPLVADVEASIPEPAAPEASPLVERAFAPLNGSGRPRGRRVLVVDDNVDAAESLGRLLTVQGHQVVTCNSGRDAVALARSYAPEVIFMDIGMPDMDGLTASRLIREQPGGSAIRIVALTGWGQAADRRRTREAGIDEHLVKPVSTESLRKVLAFSEARS